MSATNLPWRQGLPLNGFKIIVKEFDLIGRYFSNSGHKRKDVVIGIGDDCAVTTVPENQQLAVTTDTLVAGVHFLKMHLPNR